MEQIKHYHILVKGEATKLAPITCHKDGLTHWMHDVVRNQGMRMVIEPRFYYVWDEGNEGFTGSCNLATSHLAMHIWDVPRIIQADLYTCGELDIELFLEDFKRLGVDKVDYVVFNRDKGFEILKAEKGRLLCE